MHFSFSYLLASFPRIAEASLTNLRLALMAMALALAGGTLLTILRSLKIRPVNAAIAALLSFIRGTPVLIQIFLAYYGLPVVTGLHLTPDVAGVAALALNSSFFISEIMRAALPEIDAGQVEAAFVLGLSPAAIWRRVLLPQLIRRIAPMLVNEGTIIVKGTALLSVITVVEALRVSQQIGAAHFQPFEPILAASIMFLAINFLLTLAGWLLERHFAREIR